MKVNVYTDTCVFAYSHVLAAFARGVMRSSTYRQDIVKIIPNKIYHPSNVAVIMWSPKITDGKEFTRFRKYVFEQQKLRGMKVIIIETAIIRGGRKHSYFRIGIDDVSNLGEFANENCPINRWKQLKKVKGINLHPWKEGNKNKSILVVGQYPFDFSLGGINFNNWIENTIKTIKQNTNRPIIYKPHPVGMHLPQPDITNVSILKKPVMDWGEIHATVSYSSGMAVDGILRGVPAITSSERSFAWEISSHDLTNIENIIQPPREQWLNNLTYAQWNITDMRRGIPWTRLRKKI